MLRLVSTLARTAAFPRDVGLRAIVSIGVRLFSSNKMPIDPVSLEPPIPVYKAKAGETSDQLRARLVYQSRKRGTTENGLLLSTFADKYLEDMSMTDMKAYDHLINTPANEWDIYYWATGAAEVPEEFQSLLMTKLQIHTKNDKMEARLRQPDLKQLNRGL